MTASRRDDARPMVSARAARERMIREQMAAGQPRSGDGADRWRQDAAPRRPVSGSRHRTDRKAR